MKNGSIKLQDALAFAVEAHQGQFRDGEFPLPYSTHPIEVLMNLRYTGGITDEDMLCTAALHDVLEASEATQEIVAERFGERVGRLVTELTRREPTASEIVGLKKSEVWELRSRWLLGEIAAMSHEAKSIKLADRLANLRDARRYKGAIKLDRYLRQTEEILKIIDERVNPALWQAVREEIDGS